MHRIYFIYLRIFLLKNEINLYIKFLFFSPWSNACICCVSYYLFFSPLHFTALCFVNLCVTKMGAEIV